MYCEFQNIPFCMVKINWWTYLAFMVLVMHKVVMHETNKSKWNMFTLVYILKFDLNAKLKYSTLKYSFKAFDIFKNKIYKNNNNLEYITTYNFWGQKELVQANIIKQRVGGRGQQGETEREREGGNQNWQKERGEGERWGGGGGGGRVREKLREREGEGES